MTFFSLSERGKRLCHVILTFSKLNDMLLGCLIILCCLHKFSQRLYNHDSLKVCNLNLFHNRKCWERRCVKQRMLVSQLPHWKCSDLGLPSHLVRWLSYAKDIMFMSLGLSLAISIWEGVHTTRILPVIVFVKRVYASPRYCTLKSVPYVLKTSFNIVEAWCKKLMNLNVCSVE